jgi:hypothetical protein
MENEIHNIKIQNIFSMISIISIQSQNLILLEYISFYQELLRLKPPRNY